MGSIHFGCDEEWKNKFFELINQVLKLSHPLKPPQGKLLNELDL